MVDPDSQTPVQIHTATVRVGVSKAERGELQGALSADVFAALAYMRANTELLGLYLTLLSELVGAHHDIRKADVERSIKALMPKDEKDGAGKVTAADEIVALVTEQCTLFTDQEDRSFALLEQDGHREVWAVESSTFKDWVSMQLYQTSKKTPRASALADAFSTLNGIARHEGETHDVHLRVAPDGNGGYYIDIVDDAWRIVHITSDGWQILADPPIRFRRSSKSKPIPLPTRGGKADDLAALVNIEASDRVLLITSLLSFLRPDMAYPVVELVGEQGSGKSKSTENIRRLVDPHTVNLRSAPKNVEDIFVNARNNHVVCFNNLSRLSGDEQDALCNLSTGGGFSSRKLYSNDEEVTYDTKRPVLINGINATATQSDLISRLVRLECPTLEGSKDRLEDQELSDIFEKRAPLAMGFLLDTMASALAILADIELIDKPRMIDFAKLGAAVGRVLDPVDGERTFLNRYRASREAASLQALESMPVIVALIDYLLLHQPYTGNYAGLLKEIEEKIGKTIDAAWPKSGRGLSDAINRSKPTLNLMGWSVRAAGRDKHGARVTIAKKPETENINNQDKTSTTSTMNTVPTKGANGAYGAGENPQNYSQKSVNNLLEHEHRTAELEVGGVL